MELALKHTNERDRLTVYLGGAKRRKLIDFAKQLTHASSDSEAIFSALELLKNKAFKDYKRERTRVFKRTRGLWGDLASIGKILADIEKGWTGWDRATS